MQYHCSTSPVPKHYQSTTSAVPVAPLRVDPRSTPGRPPVAQQCRPRVGPKVSEFEALWLRRVVEVPDDWPRAVLHVGACDWECTVYLNRQLVGVHRGGYDPWALDITDFLREGGGRASQVEVMIRVWDPTDSGCEYGVTPPVPCNRCCKTGWQPRGKQSLQPGFIMYSAATGPWQDVWLEEGRHRCLIRVVDAVLVNGPAAIAGETAVVRVRAQLEQSAEPCGAGMRLLVVIGFEGKEVARSEGDDPFAVTFEIAGPVRLWSPDDPALYSGMAALCEVVHGSCGDVVEFHFGLRWLSVSSPAGVGPSQEQELLLNGQRVFQHGVLYQAYWPESLIAPPSVAALMHELQMIKDFGFNMMRVHAAVMPPIFYYFCDQLGLLVWQDMPGGDGRALPLWDQARADAEHRVGYDGLDEIVRTDESKAAFWQELQGVVSSLSPFASIVCWTPFNEAWGQFQTLEVVRWLREFGGGRWVNSASGWNDIADLYPGADHGDVADVHNYEGPPFQTLNGTFTKWPLPFAGRALALGEYGGLGLPVDGHEWSPENSWAYGEVSRTLQEFEEAMLALAGRLVMLLCESRVSAAVYTQWNDIETEVNGLVTYDRAPKVSREVMRHIAALLAAAHDRCRPGPPLTKSPGALSTRKVPHRFADAFKPARGDTTKGARTLPHRALLAPGLPRRSAAEGVRVRSAARPPPPGAREAL